MLLVLSCRRNIHWHSRPNYRHPKGMKSHRLLYIGYLLCIQLLIFIITNRIFIQTNENCGVYLHSFIILKVLPVFLQKPLFESLGSSMHLRPGHSQGCIRCPLEQDAEHFWPIGQEDPSTPSIHFVQVDLHCSPSFRGRVSSGNSMCIYEADSTMFQWNYIANAWYYK